MKEKKDSDRCIFCAAAAAPISEDPNNLVTYRGRHCFVILNRFPYTSGHLMIAPYQHAARLGEMPGETTHEMADLAREAESLLQIAYNPDGLNIGLNLGEAAGAGIEQHVHMHVLPRWKGDANFMTSIGNTRIIPETLEQTYSKIKEGFERKSKS